MTAHHSTICRGLSDDEIKDRGDPNSREARVRLDAAGCNPELNRPADLSRGLATGFTDALGFGIETEGIPPLIEVPGNRF